MQSEHIFRFLEALRVNNSIEWMHENKAFYTQARQEFLECVQALIDAICAFDASVAPLRPQDLTFKLNRDTRFSHDKSPYNPAFRAHICSAGRVPIPAGYFIAIKPEGSFLGGGIFATQFPQAISMVRDALAAQPEAFSQVQGQISRAGLSIGGEALKNVPAGYDKAHPLASYIKQKSWFIEYPLTDAQVRASSAEDIAAIFCAMKPLNDFLNAATAGFEMPRRK